MTPRPRTTALLLAAALLLGIAAAGARERGAQAGVAATAAAGEFQPHRWRGGFWRPAGSAAERPALRLERATFTPDAKPHRTQPGTLAALRAVEQLALLD